MHKLKTLTHAQYNYIINIIILLTDRKENVQKY